MVYSKESIIAEKFQAMVYSAQANSRMKDFYDIAMLASSYDYDCAVLREAVAQTLERRATLMSAEPIIFTDAFAADSDKQKQWSAFASRIKVTDASLENELSIIYAFLCPVYQAIIHEKDFLMTWRHTDRAWTLSKSAASLFTMAAFTKRLPIVYIPEKLLIPAMGCDMIHHHGWGKHSHPHTLRAQWMCLKVSLASGSPPGIISAIGCITPQAIGRKHRVLPAIYTAFA